MTPPAVVHGDSEQHAPFVTIEVADPRPDYAGLYAAERIESAERRPVTDAERRKRPNAVDFPRASVGLEGFKVSKAEAVHAHRFVVGEIQLAEFVEPKWSQGEAIAFECARDAITDMHAILTRQIVEETGKEQPDNQRLASLLAERSRLFQERAALHVKDHAEIARVRAEYGGRVRAWRA